jgi:hypothetical protein
MAKNDVRSRTVTFLAAQSAILGVIMLAFIVLASVLFVKNATRWQMRNIEEDLLIFAKQASRSGEVPRRGDVGAYTFFILTPDGKYVLPRMPRSDDGEQLWQEYEHKLLYEMQKRRDGWIYYPDESRLRFGEGRYAIRYIYLDQQGWIVAVEAYVSSEWSMLQGFLTPKLFLGLFLVVCLAFGLMLLNSFWHFRKVMKAILRAQENNFIAAPPKAQTEQTFIKREDSPFSGGIIQGAVDRALPKSKPVERAMPIEESEEYHERSERRELSYAPKDVRKEPPAFNPRQLDNLGEMTIDTTDIRSPLLKKAIEQLREEKK